MTNLSITATARSYPRLPFDAMKDAILGTSYELSLVFVGRDRARSINQTTRTKSYAPNVLSFPLTDGAGEIFITPTVARTEAKKFNMTPTGYIGYLFIHGLLHLKGYDHGASMDRLEATYCKKFNLK